MSWYLDAISPEGCAADIVTGCTSNLLTMLDAAGFELERMAGRTAKDVARKLRRALARLRAEPERFDALNPSNGWGSRSSLVEAMPEWIKGLEAVPSWRVRIEQ